MLQLALRIACFVTAALLTGCATRSISDPARPPSGGNATYAGELSDFDVVGAVSPDEGGPGTQVVLKSRERVLVVQSGAIFPDERMLSGLGAHFDVGAASGVPTSGLATHGMRNAAARGGFEAIVAYWGILESSEKATEGAVASWIPIAGMFIPDSSQSIRIRMRVAIVDVRTGRWRTLLLPPIEDVRSSSMATRQGSDRNQVIQLMAAAIPAVVEAITRDVMEH